MKLITFPHVEDYLEIIGGYLDVTTGKRNTSVYWFTPIISLARYDTDVLDSMCTQVIGGTALTTKQAALAQKLILTYRRQLATKLVDVSPVESPAYRIPLRVISYEKLMSIVDNAIVLQFPFNDTLVSQLRAFLKESHGHGEWVPDKKHWRFALTEYNLNWTYAWATANGFTVCPVSTSIMDEITKVEAIGYKIELEMDDSNGLSISNCPSSLREYVETNLGGFGPSNILTLVDNSAILGYTVSPEIMDIITQEYGKQVATLMASRELKTNPNTMLHGDNLKVVLEYARILGRLPVVIYEPNHGRHLLNRLYELCPKDSILDANVSDTTGIPEHIQVIYTNKSIRNMPSIPLVVAAAGMLYGGDKLIMLQSASKVIYSASDVYLAEYDKKATIEVWGQD